MERYASAAGRASTTAASVALRLRHRAPRHARDRAPARPRRLRPAPRFTGLGRAVPVRRRRQRRAAPHRGRRHQAAQPRPDRRPPGPRPARRPGRVPPICSHGRPRHLLPGHLVPTLAMISGPWSLYAPSFEAQRDRLRAHAFAAARGRRLRARRSTTSRASRSPATTRAYREQRAQGAADLPAAGDPTRSSRRGRASEVSRDRRTAVARASSWAVWRSRAGAMRGGRGDAAAAAEVRSRRQRLRPSTTGGCSSGGAATDALYVFEPVKPRPRRRRSRSSCTATTSSPATTTLYERSSATRCARAASSSTRAGRPASPSPCPGPFDIEPCIDSAVERHPRRARRTCARDPQPGAAAARPDELLRLLLRRHHHREPRQPLPVAASAQAAGDLPRGPRTTADSPAPASRRSTTRWRASLRSVRLFQCHSGARGRPLRPTDPGVSTNSCNAVFPQARAASRPATRTSSSPSADTPRRARRCPRAARGLRGGRAVRRTRCLRLELLLEGLGCAAQLRDCADKDCRYALGDTRKHRSNGRWSDGVPIAPLTIQDAAPILP